MPIYEFQCKACAETVEELSSMDQEQSSNPCKNCSETMYRIMSATKGLVQNGTSNRASWSYTSKQTKPK